MYRLATVRTVLHGMSLAFAGAKSFRNQVPALGKPSAGLAVAISMRPQLRATPWAPARAMEGAAAAATRDASGNYVQSMTAWPRIPTALGSYTCYRPGQFTSIAGTEGTPIGHLYFAGEHCNSFYDQQGFMEGAIHSGADTSAAILSAARAGV